MRIFRWSTLKNKYKSWAFTANFQLHIVRLGDITKRPSNIAHERCVTHLKKFVDFELAFFSEFIDIWDGCNFNDKKVLKNWDLSEIFGGQRAALHRLFTLMSYIIKIIWQLIEKLFSSWSISINKIISPISLSRPCFTFKYFNFYENFYFRHGLNGWSRKEMKSRERDLKNETSRPAVQVVFR